MYAPPFVTAYLASLIIAERRLMIVEADERGKVAAAPPPQSIGSFALNSGVRRMHSFLRQSE